MWVILAHWYLAGVLAFSVNARSDDGSVVIPVAVAWPVMTGAAIAIWTVDTVESARDQLAEGDVAHGQ
jgi:hypothetical protein